MRPLPGRLPDQGDSHQERQGPSINELCIDCGECIRFCPHGAIDSQTTSFSDLNKFQYKVAIPTTVLYGQFDNTVLPNDILFALRRIGFDQVYDLSSICELTNAATREVSPRASQTPAANRLDLSGRRPPDPAALSVPLRAYRPHRAAAGDRGQDPAGHPARAGHPGREDRDHPYHALSGENRLHQLPGLPGQILPGRGHLDPGHLSAHPQGPAESDEDAMMRHLFPETLLSGIGMGTAALRRRDARASRTTGPSPSRGSGTPSGS